MKEQCLLWYRKLIESGMRIQKNLIGYERRLLHGVVTGVFLVVLSIGACNVSNISGQDVLAEQEQGLMGEEQDSILETNPMIQTTNPMGGAQTGLTVEGIPEDLLDNQDGADLTDYIYLQKKFASSKSLGTRYISGTCVNFRMLPSLDSQVLHKLYRNTAVELLLEDVDGFSLVRYKGQVGYMYSEYLSETIIKTEYKPQNNYGNVTNLRERVALIAKNNQGTQPCIGGYCAKWVSGVYQAAGLGYPGGNAIDYWTRWGTTGSTSWDNIPVGAVVVGSGSGSAMGNRYGHVGIYIGNGLVADNIGYHRIVSIQEWMAYNVGTCHGYTGYIGWVWPYGQAIPQ